MSSKSRSRWTRRGRTTGLPPAVIILAVIAMLAGSVVVSAEANVYPALTQGLHDYLLGTQSGGLQSTLIVTGTDGSQIYKGTTLTRFSYLQLQGGGELYNSTSGASGSVSDTLTAQFKISSGTPTNYTITGSESVLVDGRNVSRVPIALRAAGAPSSNGLVIATAARSGAHLWTDFGGAPSATTSHVVSFATSGSATVCFTEGPCVTHTWVNNDIQSVNLDAVPQNGAFAVSITSNPDNIVTSNNSCPSGYVWTGTQCAVGAGGNIGGGSVVGSTLVLMADGSQKPIDQVKAGDILEAYEPGQGFAPSTVRHVKVVPAATLNTFNGAITSDSIQPFFAFTNRVVTTYATGFTPANELRVGDILFDPVTGQLVPIASITVSHTPALVYDLQLSGFRNYVANGILVNDAKTYLLSGQIFVFSAAS